MNCENTKTLVAKVRFASVLNGYKLKLLPVLAGSWFLLASGSSANLFVEAQNAAVEGVPQVTVEKLQEYLALPLSQEEHDKATLALAKTLLDLRRQAEAREILKSLPETDESNFDFIQSYLAEKNWSEVLRRLENLPAPSSQFYAPSIFARAEAKRGLGQTQAALEDYRNLKSDPLLGDAARLRIGKSVMVVGEATKTGMEALLVAESDLAARKYDAATSAFRALLQNPKTLTARAFARVRTGLARCLIAQNQEDEAEDLLEKFIDSQPDHPDLDEIFAELNRVYQTEKSPSPSQLRRWSKDTANPARQALAIFYQSLLEQRDKGSEAALATLENWLAKFPSHPLRADVLLHYGELLSQNQKWIKAITRLQEGLTIADNPATLGRMHAELGASYFATEKFDLAAQQYELAARILPDASEKLLYNATLSWLRSGDMDKFLTDYQAYTTLYPNDALRGDLLLESGLLQARSKQPTNAMDTLKLVIRSFPKHPRLADAWLALAELTISLTPADSATAQADLAAAAQSSPSPQTAERIDYLQLFQNPDHSIPSVDKQLERGEAFLKAHPNSKLEPEVRFKMGEAFFAAKNYSAAGTQFEIIAERFSDSPFIEQARFLAGQAAVRTMNPESIDRAITLFQKVVDMKGPLQANARYEQAEVKKNTGAFDEALVLFDDLLTQKIPLDLQAAALAGKGETLYLQGSTNKDKLTNAAATFRSLADLPGITRDWRNLALYKMGKTLGQMGKTDAMLTAFYDVLTSASPEEPTPELYWFYRAGYEAAETLEAQQQWKAAIAIYQKLVDAKGPRSSEATERIQRLRLEHFIWE